MKVLVTGGCGYKGHILIPKLLARGCKVVCFDTQWNTRITSIRNKR
jgi:nucleoside-diphosphate-sugar epimerase